MSYGISVAFKLCKKEEIYERLNEFKRLFTKKENVEKIIELNKYYFSNYIYQHKKQAEDDVFMIVDAWVKRLFTYKFRYNETLQCLCFVLAKTNITEIDNWFDNFVYFQNSCDQDYNYEEWKGVPYFEKQVERIKSLNPEEFKDLYVKSHPYWDSECDTVADNEYERKSLVYTLCYAEVESLWEDRIAICLLPEFEDLYEYRAYVRKIMLELDRKYESNLYHELFKDNYEE